MRGARGRQRRRLVDRPVSECRAAGARARRRPADRRPRRDAVRRSSTTASRSAIVGGEVRRNGTVLAAGELIDLRDRDRAARAPARADRRGAGRRLPRTRWTHAREEGELLAGKLELPTVRTRFRERHALIVVRGTTYRRDLRALRAYIEDMRPLLVGVDGGADAILEEGFEPDVVLGDMDSASDAALALRRRAAGPRLPGRRCARASSGSSAWGSTTWSSRPPARARTSRCCSRFEKGAELIVSVGAHFNLTEFLDKNRAGMSSTFLTRLRIGEILVDAKGVSRLYNPGVRGWQMWAFFAVALVLIVVVVLSSPALAEFFDLVWLKIRGRRSTSDGHLMGYSARYHAASLAAVFIALAIGILVGVGFGSDVVNGTADSLEASLKSRPRTRRPQQVEDLQRDLASEREFENAIYPTVVSDHLRGERIAVIGLGGLPAGISSDIEAALDPTGASTGEIAVVDEPPSLDELASTASGTALARARPRRPQRARRVGGPGRPPAGVRRPWVRRAARDAARPLQRPARGHRRGGGRPSDAGRARSEGRRHDRPSRAGDHQRAAVDVAARGRGRADRRPTRRRSGSSPRRGRRRSTTSTAIAGKVALVYALAGASGHFGVKDSADSLLPDLLTTSAGS